MCQFCVEHGEGERWYLQAKNYAYDLQSDLERRSYILDFVQGFDTMRSRTIAGLEMVGRFPEPVQRYTKSYFSKRQQKSHFGQPLTIEDCGKVFDLATSITIIPCICRMHAPNQRAEELCIVVTTQPVESVLHEAFKDYANGPDLGDFHRVDKATAMKLLRDCERDGLMHSIWTFKTPFTAAICNCNLESGCMAMRITAGYKMPIMFRGEQVAVFDAEKCSGCGACAKVCPFDAIALNGRSAASKSFGVRSRLADQRVEDCWGCGICRSACKTGAITMVDRREVPAVAELW